MVCPECGAEVPDESRKAHAEDHWPESHLQVMEREGDKRHYEAARQRKNQLLGGAGE